MTRFWIIRDADSEEVYYANSIKMYYACETGSGEDELSIIWSAPRIGENVPLSRNRHIFTTKEKADEVVALCKEHGHNVVAEEMFEFSRWELDAILKHHPDSMNELLKQFNRDEQD